MELQEKVRQHLSQSCEGPTVTKIRGTNVARKVVFPCLSSGAYLNCSLNLYQLKRLLSTNSSESALSFSWPAKASSLPGEVALKPRGTVMLIQFPRSFLDHSLQVSVTKQAPICRAASGNP